ncbi:hypothetical protein IAU60_000609 [Kwoniella sp. DSM 27419]
MFNLNVLLRRKSSKESPETKAPTPQVVLSPVPTVPQRCLSEPMIQLACTTGPSQLRSVLRPRSRRTNSTDRPIFTLAPLSPIAPPTLAHKVEAPELEILEFPLQLHDEEIEDSPCHSILATPVFDSQPTVPSSPSVLGSELGRSPCQCDVECIDPSLCGASFLSFRPGFSPSYPCPLPESYVKPSTPQPPHFASTTSMVQAVETSACSWAASPSVASSSALKSGLLWQKRASISSQKSFLAYSISSDVDLDDEDDLASGTPGLAELLDGCGSLMEFEHSLAVRNRQSLPTFSTSGQILSSPFSRTNVDEELGLPVKISDLTISQRPSCLTASAPHRRLDTISEA